MPEDKELREKYDNAMQNFLAKMEHDPNILAVYGLGSYINGIIWPRSDIDLVVVTNDDRTSGKFLALQEDEVPIQVFIYSRTDYRRMLQRFVHGSLLHHLISSSKELYSIDKALSEFNRQVSTIAERDKVLQLMLTSDMVVRDLHKAQKTLYVEEDTEKSFIWLISISQSFARLILVLNDIIPGRDVLSQVQDLNNKIINFLINDVFKVGFNKQNLIIALEKVESFLLDNKNQFYQPLFDFINETGDARSISEIDEHFKKVYDITNAFFTFVESYEWLSHHGDLMKIGTPTRITSKSRSTVDEIAFYFVGGGNQ